LNNTRTFSWKFAEHCAEPPVVLSVLLSDEAGFGIHFHSHHQLIEENPHDFLWSKHQQQLGINVW
jgi:hypothetical protein